MFSLKYAFQASLALALFGVPAGAQAHSGRAFMRYSRPLGNATLDLATGTLTRGSALANKSATTTVDFHNIDLGGFVGVDSGSGFCEWFDAGVKGCAGNQSDLMSDIVFAYCSAKLAVGSGGPGGSVRLGFYEGYVLGGGTPTTAVALLTLTGLPANSASSSFFGGFNCYFIKVRFTNLVAFADGPIGYSWRFLDVGTTGTLAGTWPFLACVGSCSGVVGCNGVQNFIDEYCPPGTLRRTFSFGTASGSFTSISMDISEATDLASTNTPYNATLTPNGDTLGASNAILATTWSATLTRNPITSPGAFVLKVRPNRVAAPNGIPAPPPVQGRVLTSGAPLATLVGSHNGTSGSVSNPIPAQMGFLCLHFACQAVTTGSGTKLSSAVEGTTGTF